MNRTVAGRTEAVHNAIFRSLGAVCLFSLSFLAAAGRARAQDEKPLPRVFMLEVQDVTPTDPGLYEAIRAQLSAAPLVLGRIRIGPDRGDRGDQGDQGDRPERPDRPDRPFQADPLAEASEAAKAHEAAVVFWIEDRDICRLFFYAPDSMGDRIHSRNLKLDLKSSWSRYQTIAVAAAYTLEGLLVSLGIRPTPKVEKPPAEVAPPPPKPTKVERTRRFEIVAAYSGSLFAADVVTHGGSLGFGFRPISPLVLAASFTQNGPVRIQTDGYRLTVLSRAVEVSTAGRIRMGSFELRPGIAWSIALCSYSASFTSSTIKPAEDGLKGVYNLAPFVAAEWRFSERVGLVGRVGANFALNETVYKIRRIEGETEVLAPFLVKLTYQLGLVIEI